MNRHPQQAASAKAAEERWRRADLARDAQAAGPHELAKLAAELGMPVTTLRRQARVARAYPDSVRGRLITLTFSHFEAVTGIDGGLALLKMASRERWSVGRLRNEARTMAVREDARTVATHPIDDAIRYIETVQISRSRKKAPLDRDSLIFELARVALTIIQSETSRKGRADVA